MNKDSIKTLEIVIGVFLFPYIFRRLNIVPASIADGLGVFIAGVVAYWLPSRFNFGFTKWLILISLISIVVFLFSHLFN